jgi:hypothetical protein
MTERLMRQSAGRRVSQGAFGPAAPAPGITLGDSTLDHRPIRFKVLPDGFEADLFESAERGQIGRGEGSLEHVEVFRTVSVRTSILEEFDPYPTTDPRAPLRPQLRRATKVARLRFDDRLVVK